MPLNRAQWGTERKATKIKKNQLLFLVPCVHSAKMQGLANNR